MSDGPEKTPVDDVQARIDALSREAEALEGDVRAAVKRLRAGLAKIGEEVAALGAAAAGDEQGGPRARRGRRRRAPRRRSTSCSRRRRGRRRGR